METFQEHYDSLKVTLEKYMPGMDMTLIEDAIRYAEQKAGQQIIIIDTPGMRELGMWEISEGLENAFSDVEQYLGQCRFANCRHDKEPGCAIKAAILSGDLDLSRWESYQKLQEEAVDKAQLLRNKKQWSKNISKFTRQRNKEIW